MLHINSITHYRVRTCDLGHAVLFLRILDNDQVEIFDPGPDNMGLKSIPLFILYDAIRMRNGGIYLFKK